MNDNMASPQRRSLERYISQFRRELTDDQQKEISGANRKAINHEIQKMQAKLGREKSLCGLARIQRFLDAMEQIEKLVTIFLNVSEAVAFIWGPVKLVLMAATAWTGCVRNLLDVYEEIADALDNLAFFQSLIQSDTRLSRVLEDYFSDILLFHRSILDFFSRPDWKGKFRWAWGDFRRKVKPTIESLKKKQDLLSDSKLQPHAILKEIQDSGIYAKDQFKQISSGLEGMIHSEQTRSQILREQEMKSFLERKLNVSLSQITSQLELPDTLVGSSGSWILTNSIFESWEANTSPQGSVLFLTGCPGAGKSTLARTIIHHLNQRLSQQSSSLPSLTHFFFKHNDVDRRSTRSMLCHIIAQVVNRDDAMMGFTYDQCSSMDYLDLSVLKSLALDCLLSQRESIIVLDGLDEAMDEEPKRAIRWCLDEVLPTASSRGCSVRALICGQEDGKIDPLLSSYPQIRLHSIDRHHRDIEEYCKAQASLISERFRLTPDDKTALIFKVTTASKGMFLYTKVVLANLASMGSKKEYKAELTSDQFPRNLDEAYGRIVQRVINAAEPSARASAKKILGLLVCSERPLRWREVQSRFCINADEGLCDPDDLRADTCKQLCSSLVDAEDCEMFPSVKAEQTITMIHETASKYLVGIGTINIFQEHIDMALFCSRYLSSRPFTTTENSCIEEAVQSGYFGFLDYAAVYYRSHVQKAEFLKHDMGSPLNLALAIDGAKDALSDLEKTYSSNGSHEISQESPPDQSSKSLGLAIQDRVLSIRNSIDTQRKNLCQDEDFHFHALEGLKRHKCPKISCSKFSVGFLNLDALKLHFDSHERSFRCSHETCFFHIVGFSSKLGLQNHTNASHGDDSQSIITFPTARKTGKLDVTDACKAGDLNKVKLFHSLGADLLGLNPLISPLKVALEAGHGHICKYLLDNGLSPFEAHRTNVTYEESAIHLAIHRKDLHTLELFLLSCQYPMNVANTRCLESCVVDILFNCPPAVGILLRLLDNRQFVKRPHTFRTLIADHLATLLAVWVEEDWAFSTGLDGIPHSNDSTLFHKRFCQLFPKLYDQSGTFSADPSGHEYLIYQEALRTHNLLLQNALDSMRYPVAAFLMDIDLKDILITTHSPSNIPVHIQILYSCGLVCKGCIALAQRLDRRKYPSYDHARLPLHWALQHDISPVLLRYIVGSTKDLNHKDSEGNTPLHFVQSKRSLIILLQRKDIDLFSRNAKGRTAFAEICHDRADSNSDLLECLFEADRNLAWTADESKRRLTPLHHAMGLEGGGLYSTAAVEFLLGLPEIEQILRSFLSAGTDGSKVTREFARIRSLEHALEVMDRIGFGRTK